MSGLITEQVKAKRQDTKLESEGAEFLVLGHLLIEGISAYKAYINFPGYDLMAVNLRVLTNWGIWRRAFRNPGISAVPLEVPVDGCFH